MHTFNLPMPSNLARRNEVLRCRRCQLGVFSGIEEELKYQIRKAAADKDWNTEKNINFYNELTSLIKMKNRTRLQGPGWERTGRNSRFDELCRSLVSIFDAEEKRDEIVAKEICRLKGARVSTRKGLLSEILCLCFPEEYPLFNAPVEAWLESEHFHFSKRKNEGQKYIYLTKKLREQLKHEQSTSQYPAKNIAELDALIWLFDEEGKPRRSIVTGCDPWIYCVNPQLD